MDVGSVDNFIAEQENKATLQNTQRDVKLLQTLLGTRNELSEVEEIPAVELNEYVCEFIISVRTKDYEPCSLRSLLASFERHLKENSYSASIMNDIVFVCYRIEYKMILLTFKVLDGMAPDYLRHLISVLPPSRYNLRLNDDYAALLTFMKIRTKKTLADRSFSCAAPRLWNLLPNTIRSTSSLHIFKIRLKTFFYLIGHLTTYYSCYN